MNTSFRGYGVTAKGTPLQAIEFSPPPLREEQVEIAVDYCGIGHSDLNDAFERLRAGQARYRIVLQNDLGRTPADAAEVPTPPPRPWTWLDARPRADRA